MLAQDHNRLPALVRTDMTADNIKRSFIIMFKFDMKHCLDKPCLSFFIKMRTKTNLLNFVIMPN